MSKTDGEREMGKGQTTDAREMKAADANAAATDGQNQLIGNETENTARIVGEARRLSPVMGDDETRREMTRRSRRGFLVGGVAAVVAFGGWRWLKSSADADGIPYPLRRAHEFNEQLSRTYFGHERLTQTFPPAPTQMPRVNGDIGLSGDFDLATWQLRVTGLPGDASELRLTLDDIRALPRVELTTELKCIEGWSDLGHWAGTRFADFAARYVPTTRSGYVSLETPDGGYYVGLDIESALHPQTLLCYEMGGQPLTPEHGAPLRLYIPVKYGIKSLKRIGTIRFTNERPADFWAERGYDWYSGH